MILPSQHVCALTGLQLALDISFPRSTVHASLQFLVVAMMVGE